MECISRNRWKDRDLRDRLLFDISRYLLEFFEVTSQTIAQAYLDEQTHRVRWRDSLYSDIAINEGVRKAANILRYLASLLERLDGEPELLATLRTYFDQQQRRKNAAEILGIHPNTLNHRLERVELLLGANLDDAVWIS